MRFTDKDRQWVENLATKTISNIPQTKTILAEPICETVLPENMNDFVYGWISAEFRNKVLEHFYKKANEEIFTSENRKETDFALGQIDALIFEYMESFSPIIKEKDLR